MSAVRSGVNAALRQAPRFTMHSNEPLQTRYGTIVGFGLVCSLIELPLDAAMRIPLAATREACLLTGSKEQWRKKHARQHADTVSALAGAKAAR